MKLRNTYKLKEVCSRLSSGKNIVAKNIFDKGDYPVYGSNGLRGYTFNKNFSGECTIIGRQGAYCGNVRYFSGDAYMTEHAVVCVANENANNRYLSYLLSLMNLGRLSGQSAQPGISVQLLGEQLVYLPDVKTQNSVSKLLSELDDKIKVNNAINDNLQQLIQTTYDYWFLQYEFPNQDGKPYKSNNGEFKWSSRLKREIPVDWEVYTLKDLLVETKTPFDYQSVQPTIDLSVMPSGSISLSQLNESTMFQTNLFEMKQGDLLFGSIRPYLLKAGIAPCNGVVAGTVHSYRVKNSNYYNLALCLLTNRNMFNYAVKTSGGTKMPVVSSDNILDYSFAFSPKIAVLFNELGIAEQICKNVQEINALTKLREYLLPLLMNGQITIAD